MENTKGYESPGILFSSQSIKGDFTVAVNPSRFFLIAVKHLNSISNTSYIYSQVILQCVCGASPVSLLCGNLSLAIFKSTQWFLLPALWYHCVANRLHMQGVCNLWHADLETGALWDTGLKCSIKWSVYT